MPLFLILDNASCMGNAKDSAGRYTVIPSYFPELCHQAGRGLLMTDWHSLLVTAVRRTVYDFRGYFEVKLRYVPIYGYL